MTGPSPPAPSRPAFLRVLTLPDVIVMTTVAVVSPRWITRSAAAGPSALSLWLLAFVLFAWPLATAVVTLTRRYPEQGGLYRWAVRAFGRGHGFVCGWCYWVSNIFYFPSVLVFAAPNALAAFGPPAAALAESRAYTAVFVLGVLWLSTGLNVVGLRAGRWVQRAGTVGLWTPVVVLVAAGGVAAATQGPATAFDAAAFLPRSQAGSALAQWSSLCFAFVGFEIAAFLSQEVADARRTIPMGVALASVLAAAFYLVTTAAILAVLPPDAFSERTGIPEAVDVTAAQFGVPHLGRLVAPLLTAGLVATVDSWVAGSARLPFALGMDEAMPAALARLHPRYRTPAFALLVQGLVASAVFLSSLFLTLAGAHTTVTEAYDILVGVTIVANFIPYLYLFAALLRLTRSRASQAAAGATPRKSHAARTITGAAAGAGLAATAVALLLVFLPPAGTANVLNYQLNLALQTAGLLLAGLAVYRWSRRPRRSPGPAA